MKYISILALLIFSIASCTKKTTNIPVAASIPKDSIQINSFVFKDENYKYTQLGIFCKNGDLKATKSIISQGANINFAKSDGIFEYDALYVAIENGFKKIVDYLLKIGSDPNQIYNDNGLTALSLACKLGYVDIAQQFIKYKANVNGAKLVDVDYKITPILMATESNNLQIVELLLKNGADPNITDENKNSAKELAFRKGSNWRMIFEKYQGNK